MKQRDPKSLVYITEYEKVRNIFCIKGEEVKLYIKATSQSNGTKDIDPGSSCILLYFYYKL